MGTFGEVKGKRALDAGSIYLKPTVAVAANAIYWPSTSYALFGVSEEPVAANTLGAFARAGVFRISAPSAATFAIGQKIPVTVTSNIASVVASHGSGDAHLFIGRCVETKSSGTDTVLVELCTFDDPS